MGEETIGIGGPPATVPVVASLPAVETAVREARHRRDAGALERAAAMADTLAVGDGVVARRAAALAEAARADAEAIRPAAQKRGSVRGGEDTGERPAARQWIGIGIVIAALFGGYAAMAAGMVGERADQRPATLEPAFDPEISSDGAAPQRVFLTDGWRQLSVEPGRSRDAVVDLVGRVVTAPRAAANAALEDGRVYFDVAVGGVNVFVVNASSIDLAEGAYVHLNGVVLGEVVGEGAPAVRSDFLEVVSPPQLRSRVVGALPARSAAAGRVHVQVRRVEFAADETRVFVVVRNGADAPATVDGDTATLFQRGRRAIAPTVQASDGHPSLPDEIAPGGTAAGVVALGPLRAPYRPSRLRLNGRVAATALHWDVRWP